MNNNAARTVRLDPLGESNAHALARTAFAGASPVEVIPESSGIDWTDDMRATYLAALGAVDDETTAHVIYSGGAVVGEIRLAKRDATTAEVNMWLCREARGHGNGTAAVRAVLDASRRLGYRVVLAETERENTAALGVLDACGAVTFPADDGVSAEIAVPMGVFEDIGKAHVFAYAEDAPVLTRVSDVLDAVIGAVWGVSVDRIVLPVDRLAPAFFDLSTNLAGEMLQKLTTYRLNVAVVGDISVHVERSSALRDFVRECNRGHQVWFLADADELTQRLAVT